MDHLRIMGFLLLLFTTLFALQFAEARVLDHHFHNAALSQHNSAVTFDSDLDAVVVASSRPIYTGGGGHVRNYSESITGSNSGNSTHAANKTIITVELLQKEGTPGDGSTSKAPAGIEESAPIDGNVDTPPEILNSVMGVNGGIDGNILSSGQSPGVGHWEKSKSKSSTSQARTTPGNVLSSGPSPGVGNGHTSAITGTQSQLDTFNKLPSGPSPGDGHKVTTGYTEMAQESESKKSAMKMNILPSGPSPGVGNSATDGRNMMEKISIESVLKKKIAFTQDGPSPGVGNSATDGRNMMEKISIESVLKEKIAFTQDGPSPGVGNSATNGRNTMEKMRKEDEKGMGTQTFKRLSSGSSPGVGHSYTNAHLPDRRERASASEDRKGSDHNPIFHKLPGGPSPGGGHSFVEKSASTVTSKLSSTIGPVKASSSPSPGDGNCSVKKYKPSRNQKKQVEQTGGAFDLKIGCDGGGMDRLSDKSHYFQESNFYGTPTAPMFGILDAGDSRISKL